MTRGSRRAAATLAVLACIAAPGLGAASDHETVPAAEAARIVPRVPSAILTAAPATDEKPTLGQRLRTSLGRIPLRPVRIGKEPRTPDDPKPGLGIVLRLLF